ncbi:MAG: DUF4405 domain-containing protein [Desulfurococcaceae archaeon]
MAGKLNSKLVLMYIVFVTMTLAGVVSTFSGIVLLLSSTSNGFGGKRARGELEGGLRVDTRDVTLELKRSEWKYIHVVSSLLCVTLVAVHVVLNWRWIVNVSKVVLGNGVPTEVKHHGW